MFTSYRYLMVLLLGSAFFLGCDKDADIVTVELGNAPVISEPGAGNYTITADNLSETLATFKWSAADFGYAAGVSYVLQTAVDGTNFADLREVGPVGTALELAVSNERINNIMVALGLPGGVATPMAFRVVASVSNKVATLVSPTVVLNIAPVEVAIDYPKLNVPGNYQGWDPANPATAIFSPSDNGSYDGYVYFNQNDVEYKFALGSWDTNWGDDGADGTLEPNGANLVEPAMGQYRLEVNLNDLTHKRTRTDWGLIGSATPNGWDADQDMTFDPATGVWSITLDLAAGEVKFRANDDWAINFGDDGGDLKVEYNGANIAIAEAGNYTFELMLNQAVFKYTVTKN